MEHARVSALPARRLNSSAVHETMLAPPARSLNSSTTHGTMLAPPPTGRLNSGVVRSSKFNHR